MKYLIYSLVILNIGCWGYSSKDNETSGQVKYVEHLTPMFCDDRIDVDISLGVMRNGVGSMSTQDVIMWVPSSEDAKILTDASKSGQLVKIGYDEMRFSWCKPLCVVKSVDLINAESTPPAEKQ
jgi:hypothetical protein